MGKSMVSGEDFPLFVNPLTNGFPGDATSKLAIDGGKDRRDMKK